MTEENMTKKPLETLPATVNKENHPNNNLKIILTVLLIFFSATGLVFVGYWYGKGGTQGVVPLKQFSAPTGNLPEVSEGDESQETDPNWKKAMENITPDPNEDKILKYITYQNATYKFSFEYPPTKVFLEETNGKDKPLIYLDTKLIVIPDGYDAMLTPVEFHIYQSGETIQGLKKSITDSLYADKYQEKELPVALKGKGVSIEGVWKGYPYEGMKYEEVILQGTNSIITISYLPASFDSRFPQEYFDKIVNSFKFF